MENNSDITYSKYGVYTISDSLELFFPGIEVKIDKISENVFSYWKRDFEENIIQYNAVGEGMILVSNVDGDITNGDYITTSTYAGVGVLQDDDFLHSYTVAKCTEQVDWDSVEVDAELEIKVKLVACTYHCG